MLPDWGPKCDTWTKSWLPGLWHPSLLDIADAPFTKLEAIPEASDWASLLWQLTGGLPRQLARLRAEVMDWALINNISQVTTDLVFQVFNQSPKFSNVRDRNRALANHDIKALMGYQDLPLNQLREYWLKDVPGTPHIKSKPRSPFDSHLPSATLENDEATQAAAEQKRLISGLKSATDEAIKARQSKQSEKHNKNNFE